MKEANLNEPLLHKAPPEAIQLVRTYAFGESEEDVFLQKAVALGWSSLFDAIMVVLRDKNSIECWWDASANLWCSQDYWHERREGSDTIWIAHLWHAVKSADEANYTWEEPRDFWNLAWSITIKLKRLSYMSDYEPFDDPEIATVINVIQQKSSE